MKGIPGRLGLRVSAVPQWQEFQIQLLHTSVPCGGSELWTSDAPLERAVAAELCADCPVLDSCRAFADENREEFAVWGGRDFTVTRRQTA